MARRASATTSPSPDMSTAASTFVKPPAPLIPPRVVSGFAMSRPSSTTSSQQQRPKAVAGYGGHRAGDQFATGSSVNGPRKSDVLTTAMHAERSTEWKRRMSDAEPLPKYPKYRGPTRTTPLGMECFLTI